MPSSMVDVTATGAAAVVVVVVVVVVAAEEGVVAAADVAPTDSSLAVDAPADSAATPEPVLVVVVDDDAAADSAATPKPVLVVVVDDAATPEPVLVVVVDTAATDTSLAIDVAAKVAAVVDTAPENYEAVAKAKAKLTRHRPCRPVDRCTCNKLYIRL